MSHKPRWLTFATACIVAMMVITACTPAAGPTASPRASTPATATSTPAAATPTAAAATPGESPAGTPGESPTATESPAAGTPAPIGTPYPEPVETPGDPAAITDVYPNYGGDVDCEADTWNGLPYNGSVKKISAPDPQTVVFELCGPNIAFLSILGFNVFSIYNSDWLIAHTADNTHLSTMNGTGAYKFDAWQRGTEIDYSRFDGYWGDAATNARGILKFNKETASRLQELQAGTVDGIALVGPNDFETVRSDDTLQLIEGTALNTTYLGFNHNVEPWDDPLVRRAIGLALDRQRIVDSFYPPGSEVASHFTPCDITYGCLGDEWPAQNQDEARDLLAQAGFENGIDTELSFRANARCYIPQQTETATDIQAQLAEVGIRVTLDEQESSTYITNANNGDLEGLFLLGWCADYPDISNFLDYHFGTGCTSALGDCYPEIYEPLAEGGGTTDPAAREAAYTEANNMIRELVPMVPLDHGGFANAYKAGVGNAQLAPFGSEHLFSMVPPEGSDQIVFMQAGEPGSLFCADETDGEAIRACEQVMEGLYGYKETGLDAVPALAESCTANETLDTWTCTLRQGVTFHDAATFEAKDVLVSFATMWDALLSTHVGASSSFEYWGGLFLGNLNPPAPCGIEGQDACAE